MVRVLATDGMEKSAVSKLQGLGYEVVQEFYEPDVLAQKVKEFDVLIVRSATKVRVPIIDSAVEAGRLKLIIRGGVGVDNIDVDYARSKGIEVCNTPSASSRSVAEMAIGQMFSLARFIYISNVTMREGKWEKKQYKGSELMGKTLGLIGMGRIGRCTAELARAIGMKVIYTNRSGKKPENIGYERVEMDELLAHSDFISIHRPAAKDAEPVVTAESIAKMKDGVFIINTSRGILIDEDALCDGIESGKIAGAGLDVYREEPTKNERLLKCPKVSLTPHIAGSTKEAQERIGEEEIEHILRVFGK